MSVAVNASIVGPYVSGLGVYTVHVVNALEKIRPDLTVYTSNPDLFHLSRAHTKPITLPLNPAYGKLAHLARLLWTQTVLPVRLLRDNISRLFVPVPECVYALRIPQVVVVHDLIPIKFSRDYPFQYWYFRWYVAPLLRRATTIVAVSDHTKTDLVSCFGIDSRRIQVVPGGCNHDVFHPDIDSRHIRQQYGLHRYLLYVGNLHPHKNLSRLIVAFARVSARVPHQLVIVGRKDGRFFPALETLVAHHGLQERVRFVDYVHQQDLGALYAGAEAFVFPSLYEGFGLPLLEAMACGIPVISSDCGATAEVVGQAGMLADPRDVNHLGEVLEHVLTDQGVRQDLRERGLKRAQHFRWDDTARSISRLFEDGTG